MIYKYISSIGGLLNTTWIMDLIIENTSLSIDYDCGFNESVSVLKKKKSLALKCTLYLKKGEDTEKLEFIENLDSLPYTVYIKKSFAYYWVFNDCKLLGKSLKSESSRPWWDEDSMKWTFAISFSYAEVFGTNKEEVVKREIALNNLFGRD